MKSKFKLYYFIFILIFTLLLCSCSVSEDETAPGIVLNGNSEINMIIGEVYEELGAVATDDVDGNISDKIEIKNEADFETPGTYYVSYVVSDKAGNTSRVRRKINIYREGPFTVDKLNFDLEPFFSDVLCHEAEFNSERFESLYFCGDSFIGNLGDYDIISWDSICSRGATGTDNYFDMPLTIYGIYDGQTYFYNAMEMVNPKEVLFLLNNDRTLDWTPEYLNQSCGEFYKVLKEKYPDVHFIICSIMPVSEVYSTDEWINEYGFDRNDRINKMNAYMAELCREYGFSFMNAAKAVKNPETGCVYNEYTSEDGVHLSYDGYIQMVEYIKNHLD